MHDFSFFVLGRMALSSPLVHVVRFLILDEPEPVASLGPQAKCTFCFASVSHRYSGTGLCVSGVPMVFHLLSVIRHLSPQLSWASLSFTNPFCFRNTRVSTFLVYISLASV